MKTRNGFVSNSSSSSFIILSSKPINTDDDIKKHVLKTKDKVFEYTNWNDDISVVDIDTVVSYVRPDEDQSKLRLKSKIRNYLYSKFDWDYKGLTIVGFNEKYINNKFREESPVQNIVGHKVDLRKIADCYNYLMKTVTNESEWDKHNTLLKWSIRKDVNKIVNNILEKYPYTYMTEISDNYPLGSFLEHEYEWKVKHLKISNH